MNWQKREVRVSIPAHQGRLAPWVLYAAPSVGKGVWGSADSSPSGFWGRAPATNGFVLVQDAFFNILMHYTMACIGYHSLIIQPTQTIITIHHFIASLIILEKKLFKRHNTISKMHDRLLLQRK